MFIYKITYLGGSNELIRANSPRQAFDLYNNKHGLEVMHIMFVR